MEQQPVLYTIAVVDDHTAVREAFVHMVNTWPRGRVVLEACDGIDLEEKLVARSAAGEPPPHLVLVDLSMPRRDGYATVAWLRAHTSALPLVITHDAAPHAVDRSMHAGACTVLEKGLWPADMHLALDHVADTGFHVNVHVQAYLQRRKAAAHPDALRHMALEELSARELEFTELYTSEDEPTIKQVSRTMHVSEHTAESFRKRVVQKTGARTRTALLRFMLRFGLIKW